MEGIEDYTKSLTEYLDEIVVVKEPKATLQTRYDTLFPLAGKRLRPVLTLMSCDFFNKEYKSALPAALALELFHNFSLIHDDIMDEAPYKTRERNSSQKMGLKYGNIIWGCHANIGLSVI